MAAQCMSHVRDEHTALPPEVVYIRRQRLARRGVGGNTTFESCHLVLHSTENTLRIDAAGMPFGRRAHEEEPVPVLS